MFSSNLPGLLWVTPPHPAHCFASTAPKSEDPWGENHMQNAPSPSRHLQGSLHVPFCQLSPLRHEAIRNLMGFWLVSPAGIHQMTWLHCEETTSGLLRCQQPRGTNRSLPCPAAFVTALQSHRHCSVPLKQKGRQLNCTVPMASANSSLIKEQPFASCEYRCVD